MKSLSPWCRVFLGLVGFSLGGSYMVRSAHLNPGPIPALFSFVTLLVAVATIRAAVSSLVGPRLASMAVGFVLLLGAGAEVFGIYTGVPFGRYAYTSAWVPVIHLPGGHPFPILLPFAWCLIALGCHLVASEAFASDFVIVLVSGVLAAAIDLVMEPVMTQTLGYWRWLDRGPLPGGAPLSNPAGWFLVACMAAWGLVRMGIKNTPSRREPAVVLVGHLILLLGLWVIAR